MAEKLFQVHGKETRVFNGLVRAKNAEEAWDILYALMCNDSKAVKTASNIIVEINVGDQTADTADPELILNK